MVASSFRSSVHDFVLQLNKTQVWYDSPEFDACFDEFFFDDGLVDYEMHEHYYGPPTCLLDDLVGKEGGDEACRLLHRQFREAFEKEGGFDIRCLSEDGMDDEVVSVSWLRKDNNVIEWSTM
jgi:hypothetical protein